MKIGLVINPIAGVGAKLAWKGTDNNNKAWLAIDKGELQPVWDIVNRAFEFKYTEYKWFLGGDFNKLSNGKLKIIGKKVYQLNKYSSKQDTVNIITIMNDLNLDLIVFAGGDGTANDIALNVSNIPIIGIPSGVKIFSPCFIQRPEHLNNLLRDWDGSTRLIDLFDLDEELYKLGQARQKLVGKAIIPNVLNIQNSKISWSDNTGEISLKGIAERILNQEMMKNKTILIGTGSTLQFIFKYLNINTSLLGIDILQNGKLISIDNTFSSLLKFHKLYKIDEIWVSPIGNQGFILGRGNRQIPIDIIKSVWKNRIIIFSTSTKINNTKNLYTDIGENALDEKLSGYYKVITGYHTSVIRKLNKL